MNQHSYVSVRNLQVITDIFRIEIFHLTQHEDLTLLGGQRGEAVIHGLAGLLGRKDPFEIFGYAGPMAAGIEERLKRRIERVNLLLALQGPSPLAHLVM